MSENRRLSNLGPLALAIRDAASLREALQIAIRYLRLHTDVAVVSFEESDDLAIVKIELIGGQFSSVRQVMEMAIGVTHRVMRQLLGSPRQSWLVWFSHSTPTNMTTHLRVFGNRVEFGRDFTGILCETSDLDAPLPAADPVMARHIKQYLEPLLAHANATVSDKVRQLVYELLPSGRCSAEGAHRASAWTAGRCTGISPVTAKRSRRSSTPRGQTWHSAMSKTGGDL
jgi:hypothetical protein